MDEQDVYKGGTLITNLEEIEVEGEKYVFSAGDKVIFAIKRDLKDTENILCKTVDAVEGETSIENIFTAEETNEKFVVGRHYELQADLINSQGTFPMYLQNLKVVGQAIVVGE